MIGWLYWANNLMNIAERRSAPHSAPVRVLRSAIASLALMWCKYLQISSVRLFMSRGELAPVHYQESAKLKMTCLKQRFLWILPDYARFTQNMNNMPNYAKNILAKKATKFLPKESKLCPIFKIWQKICQNGNAGLSSHNLKTASDVLCDKSHVTIVHYQCHKKRISIVIHLNPLRRTVFHIFSEVHSFFCRMFC